MKVLEGDLVDLEEDFPPGHLLLLAGGEFPRHKPDAVTFSQFLEGLGERKMAHLHKKGEHISPFAASETVVDLLFFVDHEGRGLFGVEGTEPLVVLPRLLEAHVV